MLALVRGSAFSAIKSASRVVGVRALSSAEVPVNNVARIAHLKVAGEQQAVNIDEAVADLVVELRQLPGFKKVVRQVCKTEWGKST